jgi:hypothetical protein
MLHENDWAESTPANCLTEIVLKEAVYPTVKLRAEPDLRELEKRINERRSNEDAKEDP